MHNHMHSEAHFVGVISMPRPLSNNGFRSRAPSNRRCVIATSRRPIGYKCTLMYILCIHIWYAGVAVPQVLQQLREFDAPAMQSCKPLPCGTGSCQNRRLREQTLTRKPCHCGSIKGRLMYGTPNISRPATAGTNSLRLS